VATNNLRDYIHSALFTRPPKKNFRVLGIGPHKGEIPLDKGRDLAAIWGSDPLHWAPAAYHIIIETVLKGTVLQDLNRMKVVLL
jgi:hypothetical protein